MVLGSWKKSSFYFTQNYLRRYEYFLFLQTGKTIFPTQRAVQRVC